MDHDSLAYLAITQLHGRYADIATRRAWGELADLVRADSRFSFELPNGQVLELVGPAALAEFGSRATAQFSFYQYVPLNTVVTVTGDSTATGRFFNLEIGMDTGGEWTEFYGRYEDDFVTDGDRWLFARRAFQVLATRTTTPGPR